MMFFFTFLDCISDLHYDHSLNPVNQAHANIAFSSQPPHHPNMSSTGTSKVCEPLGFARKPCLEELAGVFASSGDSPAQADYNPSTPPKI
jgi:hypothetical protein